MTEKKDKRNGGSATHLFGRYFSTHGSWRVFDTEASTSIGSTVSVILLCFCRIPLNEVLVCWGVVGRVVWV